MQLPDKATGRKCVQYTCKEFQVLQPTGACSDCTGSSIPSTDGTVCEAVAACKSSDEILKFDGKCETCPIKTAPDTQRRKCISEADKCVLGKQYLDDRGKCQDISTETVKWLDIVKSPPDWDSYGPSSSETQTVQKYWSDAALGGGQIVFDLLVSGRDVKTPFKYQIYNDASVAKYYAFKNLKFGGNTEEQKNLHYDFWLLVKPNPKVAGHLTKLANAYA